MNFFSSKTLQKTISVLMLIMVCWMAVPQGVDAVTNGEYRDGGRVTEVRPDGSYTVTRTHGKDRTQLVNFDAKGVQVGAGQTSGVDGSFKTPTSNEYCTWSSLLSMSGVFVCLSSAMLTLSGYFLFWSAIIFNFLLDYTLNMPRFVSEFNIVDIGWGAFRDISLVFFVFIILFIAINMIVGKEQYGSKKLLAQVIVAAILINFSLFFTKVLVDTSNIIALQFYGKIVSTSQETLIGGNNQKNLADPDSGISAAFAHSMGLDQIWATGAQNGEVKLNDQLEWQNILMVGIFGSLFILVTAVVFLAGAIMMLVRTLALIFLMILSPFAWLGGILPMTKELSSKWWSALSSNLIYAPVYMMLMYVVMSMLMRRGERSVNFLGMFTNEGVEGMIVTAFTFVVLNALMLGCIVVATKAGAAGASFATKTAGGAVLGTAAWAGRNSFGSVANTLGGEGSWLAKQAKTNGFARAIVNPLRKVSGASFDVRSSKIGKLAADSGIKLGDGQKGGYDGDLKKKIEAEEKYAKSLDMSPEEKAKYGSKWHKQLTHSGRMTSRKLGADFRKKEKIDAIKKEMRELRNLPAYVQAKKDISAEEKKIVVYEAELTKAKISGNASVQSQMQKNIAESNRKITASEKIIDDQDIIIEKKKEELTKETKESGLTKDDIKKLLKENKDDSN